MYMAVVQYLHPSIHPSIPPLHKNSRDRPHACNAWHALPGEDQETNLLICGSGSALRHGILAYLVSPLYRRHFIKYPQFALQTYLGTRPAPTPTHTPTPACHVGIVAYLLVTTPSGKLVSKMNGLGKRCEVGFDGCQLASPRSRMKVRVWGGSCRVYLLVCSFVPFFCC